MTHEIVVTHRAFPETLAILGETGTVRAPQGERMTERELRGALTTARAAMVFMPDRIDAAFLAAAPRLTVIAAVLKGYDNIDVAACTAHGVWLSIVPDLLTVPTAELAVGLIIGLARHLREADRFVRSDRFAGWRPHFYGLSIENSTIGLIGMGAIGRAIAIRLGPFGCRLLYCDDRVPQEATASLGTSPRALTALLSESDVVVLCAPLYDATIHLINKAMLALMKPSALLVNPARGSLVDEAAVAQALENGRLGGYAADVFEIEDLSRRDRPQATSAKLLANPNTLFSAHIGSATVAARRAIEARAAENIVDDLGGVRPRDAINCIEAPA